MNQHCQLETKRRYGRISRVQLLYNLLSSADLALQKWKRYVRKVNNSEQKEPKTAQIKSNVALLIILILIISKQHCFALKLRKTGLTYGEKMCAANGSKKKKAHGGYFFIFEPFLESAK